MCVCGCESWKRWLASGLPWLPQTASCNTELSLEFRHTHKKNDNTKPLWSSDYLGAPKKPPWSAPRQDMATRTGITGANPWKARLANVCRGTNSRSDQQWHTTFTLVFPFFLMIHKARNGTDHSHSIWQKHLSGSHHGVVGHINKHIKDCHCHNGQDYCQWHVSDKAGYTQRDITAGGNLVFKKNDRL